jgi:hypothetical protein
MVRPVPAKARPRRTTSGSIREVRLLGVAATDAGPARREGGRLNWAGRAYRVAERQNEPLYLHLEPISPTEPAF